MIDFVVIVLEICLIILLIFFCNLIQSLVFIMLLINVAQGIYIYQMIRSLRTEMRVMLSITLTGELKKLLFLPFKSSVKALSQQSSDFKRIVKRYRLDKYTV